MKVATKVAAWVYGLQAFLVVPWFLGAIYRHEQSAWALREYALVVKAHGQGNALFGLYLYAIFYAAFFIVPYAALSIWLDPYNNQPPRNTVVARVLISLWFGLSFFLFMEPLFNFVRVIPADTWHGWLLILWCLATAGSIYLAFHLRRHRVGREDDASSAL